MHKKARKKLALRKQTLRGLSEQDLGRAAGGTLTTTGTGTIGTIQSLVCPSRIVCPSIVDGCPSTPAGCGTIGTIGGGTVGPQF